MQDKSGEIYIRWDGKNATCAVRGPFGMVLQVLRAITVQTILQAPTDSARRRLTVDFCTELLADVARGACDGTIVLDLNELRRQREGNNE